MENKIKELIGEAYADMCIVNNHVVGWDRKGYEMADVINEMHTATDIKTLLSAYNKYISIAIAHGYCDETIIAGIIQNYDKNKELNVDIDRVVGTLLKTKYPEQYSKPAVTSENNDDQEQQPVVTNNDKIMNKLEKKFKFLELLGKKLEDGKSESEEKDINTIKNVCGEINKLISSIDKTTCSKESIDGINMISTVVEDMCKEIDSIMATHKNSDNNETQKPQEPVLSQSNPVANNLNKGVNINSFKNTQQNAQPVQSSPVANNINGTGFNINNFVKPVQQPQHTHAHGPNCACQQKQSVFPHQICNLTDEQIVEEVGKHFKVIDALPAYPLYDLIKNKKLAEKMKQLNCKQRPNNPYLTQVNMNEYIDIPELLEKYNLCFTMPCNDKKKVIIVLYNTNPVQDKNGLYYPLHVFDAKKTK